MPNALRLIPALNIIFQTEIEFTPDCFAELTDHQREEYERNGVGAEPVYRVIPLEPSVIERAEDKVTVELTIVTESERERLLDAVDYVVRRSNEMPEESPTFQQRLAHLRPRLPPEVIGTRSGDQAR